MKKILSALKRIQYNSPVILSFSLLAFAALLLSYLTGGTDANGGASLVNTYLFSVYRSPLGDPLTYVRLFLHVLGHVNLSHFLNNFVLILLVGPMLEEKYGSKSMIYMIVFTAFITGLLHMLFFPHTALLGASGIVFMLILLSSFVNLQKGRIPLTLLLCIVVFIGREVADGLFVPSNISNFTHIIGGVCGAVFGYFINRKRFINTD